MIIFKLVNEYFVNKGVDVVQDLDNVEYQQNVKSLGTAMDEFSSKDFKVILEFVKFIDLYENYEKNEKINKLKLKKSSPQNSISNIKESELEELLPITDTEETLDTIVNPGYSLMAANGYNPTAARDYAYKWTSNTSTLRNNSQFPYYSGYYGCTSCWNDFTNFVSQALAAGSMRQIDGYDWYYSNSGPSHSWGGANSFYKVWKVRAGIASSVSSLGVGDVVNADFDKDGDIDHTAIITRSSSTSSSGKWLTQHTSDKEEQTTVGTW
ncbi:hypothetical protein EJA13_20505 [Bacillus canaveralius]|uniref:amidase domain-containing protein n=2 Tax=Bacillus canaveralius TaxID=1403243 RepID=UPI000F7A482C|nr:hypothetical protein EJA13_20505 [Bacillus canaveralius]